MMLRSQFNLAIAVRLRQFDRADAEANLLDHRIVAFVQRGNPEFSFRQLIINDIRAEFARYVAGQRT